MGFIVDPEEAKAKIEKEFGPILENEKGVEIQGVIIPHDEWIYFLNHPFGVSDIKSRINGKPTWIEKMLRG